jgi:diaminohydroxyphosphoribosylaminopyrimidine deaminase/5-amino-6-(5-phosphoribosylamino)uracil reductase
MTHESWMAKALQLARLGLYSTSPNPRVGCVIVKDNQLIGQGWHQQVGGPHAEIHALRQAGDSARGATAYVTLEPCSHHGRTPPCADALIDAGIARVVGACGDANPQVAGQGYDKLRAAGIEVIDNVLQGEARELNAGFLKRMAKGLPWVRVKLASSLDGRTAMASGESQWITGAAARADVQSWRARSCAVITGVDSVLIDNPAMTVRPQDSHIEQDEHLWRQPLRVVVDSQQRLPLECRLLQQPGDVLWASTQAPLSTNRAAKLGELQQWQAPSLNGHVDLTALLKHLAQQSCNEVLVESGARLAGAFVNAGLVDELVLYQAPTLLGSQARPLLSLPFDHMQQQLRWHWHDVRQVGGDIRIILRPDNGPSI